MKTKLFVAAMASLLVFASCVKDIESASVTNVRNAKAAELTSIAAYNNALAEAAVITANAEAALKAAQAEYEKAQAELIKAQAELIKVQTEEERTRLELLIVELETAKARSAAELERIAREMELELEQHKLELFKAQQAYIEYAQQLEEAERAHLIAVSVKYTQAVEDLIDLQVEKVQLEANIAAFENTMVTYDEVLDRELEKYLSKIHYLDSEIENLEKYLIADQEDLLNAIEAAAYKKDRAAIAEADAKTVWYNSMDRVNEAWGKVYNGKYMESFRSLSEYAFDHFADEKGYLYYIEDGKIGYYKDDVTPVLLFKYEKSISQSVAYNGHSTDVIDYTPAEVYTEGFTQFIDAKAAAELAKHELTVKKLTADKEDSQAGADAYKKRMDAAYPESLQKEIKEAYDKATEKIAEAETAAQKAFDAYWLGMDTYDFSESVELNNTWKAYTAAKEEYEACKDVLDNMPYTIENDKTNLDWAKVSVGQIEGHIDNVLKPAKEKADSLVNVYTAKVDSVDNVIASFKLEEKKAAEKKAELEWYAHLNDKDGGAAYLEKYNAAQKAVQDVENDEEYKQAVAEKVTLQSLLHQSIRDADEANGDLMEWEESLNFNLIRLDECTTNLEEHEAALAKAELEIEGLESKLKLAEEAYEKAIEADADVRNLWDAYIEADNKVDALMAERDAIAVYRTATVYRFSEKNCAMKDGNNYRDVNFDPVKNDIEILLPGDNLWDDSARRSYTDVLSYYSICLACVEGNEKGLELEEKEYNDIFSELTDELAFVKTCGELWDSHLNDIDSAKAVQEEYVTDWKAWVDADIALANVKAECAALSEILTHDGNIQEKIDAIYLKREELLDEALDLMEGYSNFKGILSRMKEKELPTLEVKIAVQEKLVEELAAELNALLGE